MQPSAPPQQTAHWQPEELAANPHQHQRKADKVRAMFAAIAHAYDRNNRIHSLGRDQAWRRRAVKLAAPKHTDEVLDVACGTGDLTRAFAAANPKRVVGLDYTPQMLDIARAKQRSTPNAQHQHQHQHQPITYTDGDATSLPFPDNTFDIVSIAFGIRNVSDPHAALAEFRRVLRPAGRLIVLEFDQPRFPPIRFLNRLYTERIMPRTATLLARDTSGAYRYLPRSVSTFMLREQMQAAIHLAGFQNHTAHPMTFGVVVIHRAQTTG